MSKVTITKREHKRLLTVDAHMNELDARGVDNWDAYCGSQNECDECDIDIDWGPEECPKCGADISVDYY